MANPTAPERGAEAQRGATKKKPEYDSNFTNQVIAATGPKAHPRLAQVMPNLIRHLHDFAREVDLTVAEWTAAVEMINACGRMSTPERNETQLLCDILGLESLVDEITSKQLASSATTPSAILGPFYRHDAPLLPNGSSIVHIPHDSPMAAQADSDSALITGRVFSSSPASSSPPNGMRPAPLPGATVDIWLSAPNGLYEQQDPTQPDMNLRGRFATDAAGRFSLYALRPTAYPVPIDGPAGRLLTLLDRHPMRPAHVHFLVRAPGHRPLVTQVFDRRDAGRVADDAVFAIKDILVVDFVPRRDDEKARWELEYDFFLAPL